jgi:hypothetical protein
MNEKLRAVLPRVLGDAPSHIVTVKEGTRPRDNGERATFLYLNSIAGLDDPDTGKAMRITVRDHAMSDLDEQLVAAALAGGKDVCAVFNHGFADALDFLNAAFDAAEGVL